jgi:hypothetical protein
MTAYPVHYIAERPARFTRLQLVVRILAFIVLGVAGVSLGMVFLIAYLGLPLYAAIRLAGGRDPATYVAEDGARIDRLLRWFAAVYAWLGLVAERPPEGSPNEAVVRLEIERAGHPTPASALWRVLMGLPSALVLWLLGAIGCLVWLWAALCVLVSERVGESAYAYLTGLQRWTIRLLAYQASIVEPYPPFSFEEPPPALPAARAAP